tara:strand:- start:2704 stop:3186 length:483 start_codon:yes stop_codon:yes gene_type:complete
MRMRQMMLAVVLVGSVVSTGCGGMLHVGGVIKVRLPTTSSIPSWMAQDEGVVVYDAPSSTLRVHIGPTGYRDAGMQRVVCAEEARIAMALYMGWASTDTTTTESTTNGTTTTTTATRHQITMKKPVSINIYHEGGDYMNPVIHCVGIVKVEPTTPTTPVE